PAFIKYCLDFRCIAPERLLAKHCRAVIERPEALLGMQRARRCDHDSVATEREQFVQGTDQLRVRRKLGRPPRHFFALVTDADSLRLTGGKHRFHTVAADPSRSEEAQPDHAGVTTALTKLPGRSRVAFRASSKWPSG